MGTILFFTWPFILYMIYCWWCNLWKNSGVIYYSFDEMLDIIKTRLGFKLVKDEEITNYAENMIDVIRKSK